MSNKLDLDYIREDVLILFYRTELSFGEEIIDNTIKFISDTLNVKEHIVNRIVCEDLDKKFEKV